MLTFLAPGFLYAAGVAAAGLVAAHFIVRRQPRALLLPTARFVPDVPVVTAGWARAPADLLTLTLRVLSVILAGLALAGPVIQNRPGGVTRVILADRSRAVADSTEVSDSVAAVARPGDVIVEYASTASPAADRASAGPQPSRNERGSLSAALVAAVRAAAAVRDRVDSLELVIVSTFAVEQLDAATAGIRRQWPGRARLVPVAAAVTPETSRTPEVVTTAGDAFEAAVATAKPLSRAETRVVRMALDGADSTWVASATGRVLVHWPATVAPVGFIARPQMSLTHAALTENATVVTPLERRWQHVPALGSRPVAWWIDGEVAAAERSHGNGCVRSVAVPVSATGDFVLRPDFHALLRELMEPCGGATRFTPMPAASMAELRGPPALASAAAFARPGSDASPMTKWLLIAALACALLELFVRRLSSRQPAIAAQRAWRATRARKAA